MLYIAFQQLGSLCSPLTWEQSLYCLVSYVPINIHWTKGVNADLLNRTNIHIGSDCVAENTNLQQTDEPFDKWNEIPIPTT